MPLVLDAPPISIIGAKGEPCWKCHMVRARFLVGIGDDTFAYVCSFCEVGLASEVPDKPSTTTLVTELDEELD